MMTDNLSYNELLPDASLSHHVESFWKLESHKKGRSHCVELFLPTCTYNIIFIESPCLIRSQCDSEPSLLRPGVKFCGIMTSSITLSASLSFKVVGVRIKPFALCNLMVENAQHFRDAVVPIKDVFSIKESTKGLMSMILKTPFHECLPLFNQFLTELISKDKSIDESLRARCNYIMEFKGAIKLTDLLSEFKISKTTLRKQFLHKIGINPKRMCQIWRMNHILQLAQDRPHESFTMLSYEAGYYDQSHFIRDFKSTMSQTPIQYVKNKHSFIKVEYLNISRRFTNQYDPR